MKSPITFSVTLFLACLATGCQEPASPAPGNAAVAPPEMAAGEAPAPAADALRRLSLDEVGAPSQGSTLCNLEYLGPAIFTEADATIGSDANAHFTGWIGDETTRNPAGDATLRLESVADTSQVWESPLTLGTKREDVAASFHEPKLELSGFSQDVSLGQLPAGRYHLYVSYPSQGKRFLCDNGRHIVKAD